jgi:hypothetical protein
MQRRPRLLSAAGLAAVLALTTVHAASAQQAGKIYELRTYTAHPGKLPNLLEFFQNDTEPAFKRHDMKAIAYWVPQDAPAKENTFIYILEHPSREEANKNWDAFRKDAEWTAARMKAEASGPITAKVVSVFMAPTDYSQFKFDGSGKRVYELRTYVANPNKLGPLNVRFRDDTIKVFNKYDMRSVGYWVPTDGPDHETTLIYVLSHASRLAAADSWKKFGADPDWVKARDASEAAGPILSKPPAAVFMEPTAFSAMK